MTEDVPASCEYTRDKGGVFTMRSARFISMIVLAAAVAVAAALAVENLVLASISLARGE